MKPGADFRQDVGMRCLVTGGSGFIGGHLVDTLLVRGHDVAVLDVRRPGRDVEWIQADVRDEAALRFKGFEAVFHLAALSNARECAKDPALCCGINVCGTARVVGAAHRDGVGRVLLASSGWVSTAQPGACVEESTPFDLGRLNGIYGASKLAQEMVCSAHFAEAGGPQYTILRYGTPYGDRMWEGLVIRAFMKMAESRGVIPVMGDGTQYREFLHVGDLCDAQELALRPAAVGRVYNLTGNVSVAVLDLAREVARHFKAKIEHIPMRQSEPETKRILNDRARSELGWEPRTSLEEGIARCVAWWRSLSEAEKNEPYWLEGMPVAFSGK